MSQALYSSPQLVVRPRTRAHIAWAQRGRVVAQAHLTTAPHGRARTDKSETEHLTNIHRVKLDSHTYMPAQVTEHGLLSGDCPVAADVGSNGDSCDFLKQQANPSHNLMAQAAADPSDARYGRPAVTVLDTQHLLYATVKKRRFLTNMTASCVPGEGSAAEDIHITLQLAGGDGQNAGTVDALPVVICSDRQRDVVADGIVG